MVRTSIDGGIATERRFYGTRDLAIVTSSFALCLLLLEGGGLVTWASRLEAGPAQDRWLAVLEPLESGLDAVGLTWPRKALISLADTVGSSMHFVAADSAASGDMVDMDRIVKRHHDQAPVGDGGGAAMAGAGGGGVSRTCGAAGTVESSPVQADPAAPEPVAVAIAAPEAASKAPASDKRTVILVGDSMMAVGLAPSLVRSLEKDGRFNVVRGHKSATGLSRPEIYSWPEAYSAILAEYRPDFVVCAMGGNDAQNVRYNGKVLKFGTPEWDDLYRARVREMAKLFSKGQTRTLWVGLPVMRAESFRKKIQHVNSLVKKVLEEFPTIDYVESSPAVSMPDGSYASQLQDAKGRMVKMRAADGIHLSDEGGKAIAKIVIKWLTGRMP